MGDIDKAVFALVRAIRRVAGGSAVVATLQFSTPVVAQQDDAVLVTGTLKGALSDKAARVVATGTPVTIRYDGRVAARGDGAPAWRATSVRVLRYDALRDVYVVEQDGAPSQYKSAEGAALVFSSYGLRFRGIDPNLELDYQLEAYISYPSERGETSQALWGQVTPYVRVRDFHLMLRPKS